MPPFTDELTAKMWRIASGQPKNPDECNGLKIAVERRTCGASRLARDCLNFFCNRLGEVAQHRALHGLMSELAISPSRLSSVST